VKLTKRGFVQVSKNFHTGVGALYAVGDVVGANLATMSQAQADDCVQHVLFGDHGHTMSRELCSPHAIWVVPEIGFAGLTEIEAIAKYPNNVGVATAYYKETVRGCVHSDTGFLKLVFEKKHGVLLGVHIMGEQASDLCAYGSELVNNSMTVSDVLRVVFPAVTYHELYTIAANKAALTLHGMTQSARAFARWRKLQHVYVPGHVTKCALHRRCSMVKTMKSQLEEGKENGAANGATSTSAMAKAVEAAAAANNGSSAAKQSQPEGRV